MLSSRFRKGLSSSHSLFRRSASEGPRYDYDVLVIGGGSGGLAAAKEAGKLGAKVGLLDYVTPSPAGTSWGLGGTCVNVGCIPKKLFHHASLLGHASQDAPSYGWTTASKTTHDWASLVANVQQHIKSLNFGYKGQLHRDSVTYHNELGAFLDPHTIQATNKKGEIVQRTSKDIIIAVGGRPSTLDIPGAELAITSDDIFSRKTPPGDTLVIGGAYVALETAGFLTGLGYSTTVLARSMLLSAFDRQMADMIGEHMKSQGTQFIMGCIPSSIEKIEGGKLRVTIIHREGGGLESVRDFDTVVLAVGRTPATDTLNLDAIGVKRARNNKIIADAWDRTAVPNIYAIGDCALGRPELTPTAIMAGKLLARRLTNKSDVQMKYDAVPTTVFTPLEYGCVGLSEEEAIDSLGVDAIEVYHAYFNPIEFSVAHRDDNRCYFKVICNKMEKQRVLGIHLLSPNAGEVIQGFAVAIRLNATIHDLMDTVGIHPTAAEELVQARITKRSGEDPIRTGC